VPDAGQHLEPGLRDRVGEGAGVLDRGLGVELADDDQGRRRDAVEVGAGVVGDQAVDRTAQGVAGDPLHRRHLTAEGRGGDVGAGDRGEHLGSEVARLLAGVERSEASGPPLLRRGAVEAEGRAGREQAQRGEPVGMGERRVLGDHAAEGEPDQVRPRRPEIVQQLDHRGGEAGEGRRLVERRRGPVAGLVPGDDPPLGGEARELRLPGEAAAAEAMEKHDGRLAATVLPPPTTLPFELKRLGHGSYRTLLSTALSTIIHKLPP